jgi:hypothetical protein
LGQLNKAGKKTKQDDKRGFLHRKFQGKGTR